MKVKFRNAWPVAAVVSLSAILAMQIPRKALFFTPRRFDPPRPCAAFVEISPEVYGQLVDKVRMSWQQRPKMTGIGLESRVGGFTPDVPPPEPEYLPFHVPPPDVPFSAAPDAPSAAQAPLMPPSLATTRRETLPAPGRDERPRFDFAVMAWPGVSPSAAADALPPPEAGLGRAESGGLPGGANSISKQN